MLAVEWLGLTRALAGEMDAPRGRAPADAPRLPRTPLVVLAVLLWRRVLRAREAEPSLAEFLRLGVMTVPPALILGTVALWLGLQV